MNAFDETWLHWANGGLGAFADTWLPRVGDASNAPPWVLAALVGLAAFGTRRAWVTVGVLLLSLTLTDGVNRFVVKRSFDRARPCQVDPTVELRHTHCPGSASFPSSHAVNSASIATVIAVRHPVLAAPALALSVLVGVSRVHGGVHYPTDVIAGWALGMAVGASLALLSRRRSRSGTRLEDRLGLAVETLRRHAEARPARMLILALAVVAGGAWLSIGASGAELSPAEALRWIGTRVPLDAAGLRALSLAATIASCAALFRVARQLTDDGREALAAALLPLATPLVACGAVLASPQAPATLAAVAALAAGLALLRGAGIVAWPALGVALAATAGLTLAGCASAPGSGLLDVDPLRPARLAAGLLAWCTPWVAAALGLGWLDALRRGRGGSAAHALLAAATAVPLALGLVASAVIEVSPAQLAPALLGASIATPPALAASVRARTGRARQAARRLLRLGIAGSIIAVPLALSPRLHDEVYGEAAWPRPVLSARGWGALATHVEELRRDWATRDASPRVASDEPGLAAELAFELPGRPAVALLAPSGATDPRLPPLVDRDDALFVTGADGLHPAVALAFRRCVEAPSFRPPRPVAGGPGATRVYWCERFRGLAGAAAGPHARGADGRTTRTPWATPPEP